MADSVGDPPLALTALAAVITVPLFIGIGSCRYHRRRPRFNGERVVEVANEQPLLKASKRAHFRWCLLQVSLSSSSFQW